MRIAVDVMGGDHAPGEVLRGCWDAVGQLDHDDTIVLVGDAEVIREGMDKAHLSREFRARFDVVASTQVIEMHESPVESLKAKPGSSISIMCKLAAAGGADAVISAGNTGACVAAAQLRMRFLPGVSRPGIATILPTFHGPLVLCDAGANIIPKPMHLHQYAIMAGAYSTVVCGVEEPRVGLLNVGEEDSKGTELIQQTNKLMRQDPAINFIGNIEGRDLFNGTADVVVCDGFVGNVVLKCYEGLADCLLQTVASELKEADATVAEKCKPTLDKIAARHDWQECGGAPLLGVNGYCLICHGRSEARAIKNAIQLTRRMVAGNINDRIVQSIDRGVPVVES